MQALPEVEDVRDTDMSEDDMVEENIIKEVENREIRLKKMFRWKSELR